MGSVWELLVLRETNRIGTYLASNGENFSTYKNFEDSVIDYLLWCKYFNMPTNFVRPQQFVNFLVSKGYAEDPNYAEKVLNLIEKKLLMELIETILKITGALVLIPIVFLFVLAENTYKQIKDIKDKL